MAQMSQPTTLRLPAATDELVRAEAKRTKRSKSAVLQAVADEGIRSRAFPGISFRDVDPRRRAWVVGTGLDVWEIIAAYKQLDESVERLVGETELSDAQARLAVAYYKRFPEEIDDAIVENEAMAAEHADLFPTVVFPPQP